jgi:hypothetical protein
MDFINDATQEESIDLVLLLNFWMFTPLSILLNIPLKLNIYKKVE